ncbi:MAG: orotidine-5'-phosphate decarboxylase [Bacteroidetes bacterium CG_4_9_14_3_um_filter_41_19]|nr:MAG: orotidine-5'-phosphate decarboxylase [Bacteroidetes bacterium CG_4_9_14_3_um_filter_41_19]
MTREQLFKHIQLKQSFLCIGLDSDIQKIPEHLKNSQDPVFEFNKQIIDQTHNLAVAVKPNTAFYEANGVSGWKSLEKTAHYIKTNYPDIFLIADAKRGDIGNTSAMYARTFFETMDFDAVTLAPYMGQDTVQSFLKYKDRWSIVLALTSNESAHDFQYIKEDQTGDLLFEKVLKLSQKWGTTDQLMYVVGATKSESLKAVRKLVPDHFLLVPGIGAQGGSLKEVAQHGMNDHCGLLVNSSRGIIFASYGKDFALVAREEAMKVQKEMAFYLRDAKLID